MSGPKFIQVLILAILGAIPAAMAASPSPGTPASSPETHDHEGGDAHDHGQEDSHDHGQEDSHDHGSEGDDRAHPHPHGNQVRTTQPRRVTVVTPEGPTGSGSPAAHSHEIEADEDEEHEEGHDHSHGEEEEESEVTLTPEAVANAGIEVAQAEKGRISHVIKLTGTISVHEERTVHLSPKVEGQIRNVLKTLGDPVKVGEPLLLLDSTQLGEAKVAYLKQAQEFELARVELERKTAIRDGTQKLLAMLKQGLAPLEIESRLTGQSLGEHRGQLLTAYSNLRLTETAHSRADRLYRRKITSQREFLEARKNFESAQAEYMGALDLASYNSQLEFTTAEKNYLTHRTEFDAAGQRLRILGCTPEELEELRTGKARDLNFFTVRAPIDGTIIEKHGTPGERVTLETSLFTITDLREVWVLGDVYEKDLAHVHPGMPAVAHVTAYPGENFRGKVSLVSRVIDPNTRTARVRIAIENLRGLLSVGMFVNVETTTGVEEDVISIPVNALQEIKGKTTVFVRESGTRFRGQKVTVGAKDTEQQRVEVYSGLAEGDEVVVSGVFFLRSELAKSEMGHDHAH